MKACESCGAFVAEVLTPIGEGAADHCWLCAHAYGVHEATTPTDALAALSTCVCSAHDIYPPDVRSRMESDLAKARAAYAGDLNAYSRAEPLVATHGEFRTLSEAETKARDAGYRGPSRGHADMPIWQGQWGKNRKARAARVELHRAGKHAGKLVSSDSE